MWARGGVKEARGCGVCGIGVWLEAVVVWAREEMVGQMLRCGKGFLCLHYYS